MTETAPRGKLLFISPVMPDIGGNGLAMRAGNLVESLGSHSDLHLLVLAVGGVEGRQLCPELAPFVTAWTELPYREMIDPEYGMLGLLQPGLDQFAAVERFGRPVAAAYKPEAAADAAFQAFPDTSFAAVFVLRLYMSAVASRFCDLTPRPHMLLDADDDDDDVTASCRFANVRRAAGDHLGASIELATARHYAAWEQAWLPKFDLVFTASPADSARMSKRMPDMFFDTIPNVVRTTPNVAPSSGAQGQIPFLMIGNLGYLPNVEGAHYFCTEVLPRLRALAPDLARVTIAGSSPAPTVVGGLVPFGRLWRRIRIPLAAAHTGDLHAGKGSGLAKWLVRRESFGGRPGGNIQDQHAADPFLIIFGQHRATQNKDILMLFQVGEVGRLVHFAECLRTRPVFLIDDVKHQS
jgi:hypothetical protein